MKERFPARMLRVYLNEDDTWEGKPLLDAILEECRGMGLAGAIAFRGIEGFGAGASIRHEGHWYHPRKAPLMMTIIDTAEQIERLLPILDRMAGVSLVAMSHVDAIRFTRLPNRERAASL